MRGAAGGSGHCMGESGIGDDGDAVVFRSNGRFI